MKKTLPQSLAATTLLLLPAGILAQMTGTSHPEELHDNIVASPAPHYVKPSPAVPLTPQSMVPVTAPTSGEPVLVERVPQSGTQPGSDFASRPAAARETASASRSELVVTDDPTSGVVMDVPSAPHELPAGTLLHMALSKEISTIATERGAAFTGRLLQPATRQGEVLLPAGAVLSGRVAQIHAGNRMHGGAVIQLVPEWITLPDGARHRLEAQVVDLPSVSDARVNDEGVIHGKTNIKGTAAAVGLTTASATVAGAVIGGGVGAAVGATLGVGVATVWWLRHEQEQTLPENTEIVFSLDRPLLVTPATR